ASLNEDAALVLLVDDNPALAENLAEAVRSLGFRAVVCGSVAEVRALLAEPKAAILDYRLPDGTGVDAAEALRARNTRMRTLFVLFPCWRASTRTPRWCCWSTTTPRSPRTSPRRSGRSAFALWCAAPSPRCARSWPSRRRRSSTTACPTAPA